MNQIKIDRLSELIQSNKGFTATFKGTPVDFVVGYIVSLEGFETIVDLLDRATIKDTIVKYSKLAKSNQMNFGAWVHQDKVYFDLSERYFTAEEAIKQAKKNHQLAVFNCRTKEVETI